MIKPKSKTSYVRNPIYIFYALFAVVAFLLGALFAARPRIGLLERAIIDFFGALPQFLTPVAVTLSLFGSVGCVVVLGLYFIIRRRIDIATRLLSAAAMTYIGIYFAQWWIDRTDLASALSRSWLQTDVAGLPAAYSAIAVAIGLMLNSYIPRLYRRVVLWLILLVATSELYLGVSLPLDIVIGWSIGFFAYSVASLLFGSSFTPVSATKLAAVLEKSGLEDAQLKPAKVDARGSVPFFGEYKGGKIFVKVFNQDNNAADWLFKLLRRMQYRRLEDEVPSLTPKRAIEHEAYLTLLARHNAKARVPEVLGIYKVGQGSYAMASRRLDATGLDKLPNKKVTDAMLDQVWTQIKKLHASHIIHKDLRAANVMIENNTNEAWLIDFGFSECAVAPRSFFKDNLEFIASSATKVGTKRAVAAARRALGSSEIAQALPYMQYAALSGATTTDLKAQPGLLEKLRTEMIKAAELNPEQTTKARLHRFGFNRK